MNFVLLISAYLFMEFVAWFTHKYIMHGFLWSWHRDHHRKDLQKKLPEKTEDNRFEKNDLFFLVYASPAIVGMILGFSFAKPYLVYISAGITLYGFTYFALHDIAIHNRINIPFLRNLNNKYFKAMINAHAGHHKPKNSSDFHSYGLLFFPKRYLKL